MRREVLILLLALPIAGLLLDRQGLLGPVKNAATSALGPLTGLISHAAIESRDTVKAVGSIRSLLQENAELTAENRRLNAELATKLDILHENDLLRSELSLPAREANQQGIAAFIVGRTSTSTFGTFIVNKGERDGISEGNVVVSEGALVGRVTEVAPTTSTVLPITNVNSVVPAVLVESRGVGLLKGGIRGITLDEVSRDVNVKIGESVVTSTLGGTVPPGILVGTVERTIGNPSDVFQHVVVRSPIPFNWLELVIILPQQ